MNSKLISLVASLVFLVATLASFYWLWTLSKTFTVETVVADNLKPVEIQSVKKEATNLLTGLIKSSDMPIPVPEAKMGKSNPYQ